MWATRDRLARADRPNRHCQSVLLLLAGQKDESRASVHHRGSRRGNATIISFLGPWQRASADRLNSAEGRLLLSEYGLHDVDHLDDLGSRYTDEVHGKHKKSKRARKLLGKIRTLYSPGSGPHPPFIS